MPWKLWNTRLTKTMADINGLNSTKGALVQQYIDGLTVPDRKLLSNAMEQGAYTANPQGDAKEKGERAYRRALLSPRTPKPGFRRTTSLWVLPPTGTTRASRARLC
jgi:hypothetical protein